MKGSYFRIFIESYESLVVWWVNFGGSIYEGVNIFYDVWIRLDEWIYFFEIIVVYDGVVDIICIVFVDDIRFFCCLRFVVFDVEVFDENIIDRN